MEISKILVSQRKLRAPLQLCGMLDALKSGQVLPPIELIRDAHGAVQIMDGHHRLSAIWLSGRRKLRPEEYVLIESDRYRPRFGTVVDLLRRCGIAGHRDIR
ncbi:MAG: ParB N-terminal domain-containing protein [Planctomycetaceae bacterium]|nr:ParB N-terminal domain-containing protein [Planctomycetaceae bacterium]